jgi:hypothetical protein
MMRSVTELLPDVKIAAPGIPDFLALYYLTGAVSEFLNRSEAWLEYGAGRTVDTLRDFDGYLTWPNHLDDGSSQYYRIKRCVHMKWSDDGAEIPFQTIDQLQSYDTDWLAREGSKPIAFTEQVDEDNDSLGITEFSIRVYPLIADDVDGDIYLAPRFVVVTDVVSNLGTSTADNAVPYLPDRIFYAFRNQLVSGALARLYMLPGKDWSNSRLAATHLQMFEDGIVRAESAAGREFGRSCLTTGYGGI